MSNPETAPCPCPVTAPSTGTGLLNWVVFLKAFYQLQALPGTARGLSCLHVPSESRPTCPFVPFASVRTTARASTFVWGFALRGHGPRVGLCGRTRKQLSLLLPRDLTSDSAPAGIGHRYPEHASGTSGRPSRGHLGRTTTEPAQLCAGGTAVRRRMKRVEAPVPHLRAGWALALSGRAVADSNLIARWLSVLIP